MAQQLLIDLSKCRECDDCTAGCAYYLHPDNEGMKDLHEMAVFNFTCRRCEDAPCLNVCPADALDRNSEGIVERALNLCVACKSCVAACPFGTMMNHFFNIRAPRCDYCQSEKRPNRYICIESCPKQAISNAYSGPDTQKHIYVLNEHILVKEYPWEIFKT